MAAAFSVQQGTMVSPIQENSSLSVSHNSEVRQGEESCVRLCLRELPDLEPGEINRRLEETRRELSNRRKIIIKHLPQDITSQEVRNILHEYELKYCYVDRNKGTAFVTLLNGEQAQDAMQFLHQTSVHGRDITVQLQSTDTLLCVTNLPHTFTTAQFQELARVHGNLERCFVVYSDRTGYSKGYGFVEYMKKDSASRARSKLSGHRHGDHTLMAQWADASRLTVDLLHSKCLCVDRLPADLTDIQELSRIFGGRHKPVFCQDEDSHARGFAVLEYEMAEQAEAVLMDMDRQKVWGQEVHVSLCAPGASGRSTLAALIAARGTVWSSRKGLLPEPSLAQLLSSRSNPVTLQVLGMPYQDRKNRGKFSQHQEALFLQHPLSRAFFGLGNVQQVRAHSEFLIRNGQVLQTLLRMQLAQQRLLCIKDKQIGAAPSLLGDPSRVLLQKALGPGATGPVVQGQALPGGSPSEISHDAVQALPRHPARQPLVPPSSDLSMASVSEIRPTLSGPSPDNRLPTQSASRSHTCASNLLKRLHSARENSTSSVSQSSLLGEPPRDVKLPSNPYLNLASVLPGVLLQGAGSGKAQCVPPRASIQDANRYSTDAPADYGQQYSREATQLWQQHYQARGYLRTALKGGASEHGNECNQAAGGASHVDFCTYAQTVSQYYSQPQPTAAQSHSHHRDTSKEGNPLKMPQSGVPHSVSNGSHPGDSLPTYSCSLTMPAYITPHDSGPGSAVRPDSGQTPSDWSKLFCNQTHGQKRSYSQLPVPDLALDRAYTDQHSQNHYQQDFSKKRRL